MKSDLSVQVTKWCFAAIIVLSVSMQWYGHTCGLLLTPDSDNYIAASRSLKAGEGFKSPDGSLYTYWPPLFPATLSAFDSPEQAAPWMYALVTVLIGIVSALLLNGVLENNLYKVVVLFLFLTSVHHMMISVFLWSEMNFALLVLCVTFCSLNLSKSGKYFIALLIFAFLMCIQRNAGVFILAGVCSWVLLDKTFPFRIRLIRSAVIFLVGISGLVVWNIYLSNILSSGFFFYKHEFFIHAIENLSTVSAMLVRIFIPVSGWVTTLLGLVMLVTLIIRIRRSNAVVRLIGLVVLFYWIGLICMFRLDIHDMDRFLSPIIFFIYLMVAEGLEKFFKNQAKPFKQILLMILLLWMVYPVYRTVVNLKQWHTISCGVALERQ